MMGDGRREPETPRHCQVFQLVGMPNEHGMVRVYINADGFVGVLNKAGDLQWMRPANLDIITTGMLPVVAR